MSTTSTTPLAARRAMRFSLLISVLMLVGKLAAYFITGSVAILSDASESVVHLFATGVAAFGMWIAASPADERHLYGHGKAVLFSVGIEGFLIFSAAIFILIEGVKSLVYGASLQSLDLGMLITAILALVNYVLGTYLIRTGAKHSEPALIANGKHVLTDMWTSIAVLAGVFVVWVTDIWWLDPLCGIGAAILILVTGSQLIKSAIDGVLDRADPSETDRICAVLDELVSKGTIDGYHQLRHRTANNVLFVEVHLLLPGTLTLEKAHDQVTIAERRLTSVLAPKQVVVTSHMEPNDISPRHNEGHYFDPLGLEEEEEVIKA